VNEPRYKHLNYGGWTAAPTFRRVAEQLIGSEKLASVSDYQYMNVDTNLLFIPDLVGLASEEAKELLNTLPVKVTVVGEGKYIINQSLPVGEYQKKDVQEITLTADKKFSSLMPKLKGLTLRDAMRKLKRFRISIEIKGSGRVKKQSIRAGKIVAQDAKLILNCEAR
jgi:beta-lactam-binding protein with PASTA domain